MKLLFLGSPALAVPFLDVCVRSGHEVAAVLTQPDRPSGRGLELHAPAVKAAAERLGLPVLQPDKPSAEAGGLKALGADLGVVVAYGRFLKPDLLAATRLGFLNVHFSLLPRCRGAAPVAWTLLRGESEGGVTLFWIDAGMDSGPVQRRAASPVGPDEDALEVSDRLAALGVRELEAALAELAAGSIRREPQQGEPTLAPKILPGQARLSFERPAAELHNWVRGLRLGPRAHVLLARPGRSALRLGLLKSALEPGPDEGRPSGQVLAVERERGILIQCRPGRLWVQQVQLEGKKQQPAAEFANGLRLQTGDRLVTLDPET